MKSGMGVFVFLGLMLALTILAIWPIFGVIALVIAITLSILSYQKFVRVTGETSSKLIAERPERLVNIMWRPIQEELNKVVAANGAVTDERSEWTRVEFFAKREAGPKFQDGMDKYVKQRNRVAEMLSSRTGSGLDQPEFEAERQQLVELSEDLLILTRAAILREAEQAFR